MRLVNPESKRIINEVATVTATHRGKPIDLCVCLDLKNDDKYFRTICEIKVEFAGREWALGRDFQWNGADIPRVWQFILGLGRYDPRLALASGFHDDVCNQVAADNVQRVVGDAIFVSLLMPIRFNGTKLPGIGPWRAALAYAGVRCYSGWRFAWRHMLG